LMMSMMSLCVCGRARFSASNAEVSFVRGAAEKRA
jgi:hypothetical protein